MSLQINDYESNAIIQGNIATSVEIECFPTVCAVLGHHEAVRLDEEEPKDGEAVGQQPEHLPGVLGHPADIQLVRRPLLALLLLGGLGQGADQLRPATASHRRGHAPANPGLCKNKCQLCNKAFTQKQCPVDTHGMGQHWRQAPMYPMQTVILPVLQPG